MILILSAENDEHIPPVVGELERRGAEYCWFDPSLFPQKAAISLSFFQRGGRKWTLKTNGKTVDLRAIEAVWYRRPGPANLDERVSDKDTRNWAHFEIREFLDGLYNSLSCLWVPGPPAISFRAQPKMYHLALAKEMGFTIPRTLVTSDPEELVRFFDECRGNVISKPILLSSMTVAEKRYLAYTRQVNRRMLRRRHSLVHTPVIFQENVPKKVEIRANVIGDRVLAAEIDSQATRHSQQDWRHYDIHYATHSAHELPRSLSDLCVRYTKALGLCNGAIDMILTPAGEYVFLEINPFGQWLWLEIKAGLPLTEALVDLLVSGRNQASVH